MTAVAAVTASTASAATLAVGTACARYVPGLAGEQWIPVAGSGFTPNTNPAFDSARPLTTRTATWAYSPMAADGSFVANVFMPSEFISSSSGRMKTYTLTATDQSRPVLTASAQRVTTRRAGGSQRSRSARLPATSA